MPLHVQRLGQNLARLGGAEDPDFHPFSHRHFAVDARALADNLARLDVQRHLPRAERRGEGRCLLLLRLGDIADVELHAQALGQRGE